MKQFYLILLITFVNNYTFSQYNGREFIFNKYNVSSSSIEKAFNLLKSKNDSIASLINFEGRFIFVITYYQAKTKEKDKKWIRLTHRMKKKYFKLYGQEIEVFISNVYTGKVPIQKSFVAITPGMSYE
jgi:hypothetical protein